MAKPITKQAVTAAKAQAEALIVTVEEARKAATAIEALIATWDPTHYYYNGCVEVLTTVPGVAGVIWLAHFHVGGTKSGLQHMPDVPFVIDNAGRAKTFFGTVFGNEELHPVEPVEQEGGVA